MQNSLKHKWETYNLEYIVGGKTSDNVPLLKLFLQDYSKLFHTTTLNASCSKCLQDYLNNYKQKINKMENPNTSQYRLKLKYNNIPLRNIGEGYNVMVNNNNITDAYAEILLERYSAEKIFDVYPILEEKEKVVLDIEINGEQKETTETTTENVEPTQEKRTRKRRK